MQRLLYLSAFVRAAATIAAGVTLDAFLGKLGARGVELGIVASAGLAGASVAAVLATLGADRRRAPHRSCRGSSMTTDSG